MHTAIEAMEPFRLICVTHAVGKGVELVAGSGQMVSCEGGRSTYACRRVLTESSGYWGVSVVAPCTI
jgi:hypothetical protein